MTPRAYERISLKDEDDDDENSLHSLDPLSQPSPASPPPSFRSRVSSPGSRSTVNNHRGSNPDVDRTLADTFDDGEGSDSDDENGGDDRRRLLRDATIVQEAETLDTRRETTLAIEPPITSDPPVTAIHVAFRSPSGAISAAPSGPVNDGVFANLSAKPERGEKSEEQPPSYEQAAADATPPYWETTILAPGMLSDEVYVDGLPVGSLFSFVWNGMISMSFQLVGFLLTYLLHTTHAAKNGSRAGLGITLVNYGFSMKSAASRKQDATEPSFGQPPDPNSHTFDPSIVSDSAAAAVVAATNAQGDSATATTGGGGAGTSHTGFGGMAGSEWLAYLLMIVGWFILIRAVSDFFKARRHEQLVLQSPDRGLTVPVVAEGEPAETVV